MSDPIGTLLTTPRHPLATSALPDAPVVEDVERRHDRRQAVAAALHRLAERIAPDAPRRCSTA